MEFKDGTEKLRKILQLQKKTDLCKIITENKDSEICGQNQWSIHWGSEG